MDSYGINSKKRGVGLFEKRMDTDGDTTGEIAVGFQKVVVDVKLIQKQIDNEFGNDIEGKYPTTSIQEHYSIPKHGVLIEYVKERDSLYQKVIYNLAGLFSHNYDNSREMEKQINLVGTASVDVYMTNMLSGARNRAIETSAYVRGGTQVRNNGKYIIYAGDKIYTRVPFFDIEITKNGGPTILQQINANYNETPEYDYPLVIVPESAINEHRYNKDGEINMDGVSYFPYNVFIKKYEDGEDAVKFFEDKIINYNEKTKLEIYKNIRLFVLVDINAKTKELEILNEEKEKDNDKIKKQEEKLEKINAIKSILFNKIKKHEDRINYFENISGLFLGYATETARPGQWVNFIYSKFLY
jgi:hypothetical protein